MKDQYTKQWIIDNSIDILSSYYDGTLTLRALHYQLVGLGMTNDTQHYKRVVKAMIDARWAGLVSFEKFSDLEREMVGQTDYEETVLDDEIERAKDAIQGWMTFYKKNRWENQPYYPEIFIEKKALQGVFARMCSQWDVALGACKGYPSLTFLNDAYKRFDAAATAGKKPVIIYFGDYDPSGEDIPRSIQDNIERMGVIVEVRRIALMEHQVIAWKLPHAPTKDSDTRSATWTGFGQVELDAVKPEKLMQLLEDALLDIFDQTLFEELQDIEHQEKKLYRENLKDYVQGL
jgi:hypothetical protein